MSEGLTGDWRDSALCAQYDADLWFPERFQSPAPAKAVCAECPVQVPCLRFAVSMPADRLLGVWGGLTETERRQVRAEMRTRGQVAA